jgi:hypothetical protein
MRLQSLNELQEWLLEAPAGMSQYLAWTPLSLRAQRAQMRALLKRGVVGFLPLARVPDGLIGLNLRPNESWKNTGLVAYNERRQELGTFGYSVSTLIPAWANLVHATPLARRALLDPLVRWLEQLDAVPSKQLEQMILSWSRRRDVLARQLWMHTALEEIDPRYRAVRIVFGEDFDFERSSLSMSEWPSEPEDVLLAHFRILRHFFILRMETFQPQVALGSAVEQVLNSWLKLDGQLGGYAATLRPEKVEDTSHFLACSLARAHPFPGSQARVHVWSQWLSGNSQDAAERWLELAKDEQASAVDRWNAARNAVAADPATAERALATCSVLWPDPSDPVAEAIFSARARPD